MEVTKKYHLIVRLSILLLLQFYSCFNRALKYLPASMVAITILGEPVGSTALACLILKEGLTIWKVVGGILILPGI